MGPIVIEDAERNEKPVFVASWCAPVRVWVRSRIIVGGDGYDDEGYPLHCRWLLPRVGRHGVEPKAAAPGRVELWSDCGVYHLRAGGDLFLKGGTGRWEVEVWSAEEQGAWCEPQEFWLTHFYLRPQGIRFPPFSTQFRLLTGEMTAGDHSLTSNVSYPVSLAPEPEIHAQGYWQAGTLF